MKKPASEIKIPLDGDDLHLLIFPENGEESFQYEDEASDYNESSNQLMESCCYEYEITAGYQLKEIPGVIKQSKRKGSPGGRITPGNYTGTLMVDIVNTAGELCIPYSFEVRSIKTSYREDYRVMLEEIAEKCTDLLMQHSSPVVQKYTYHFSEDPKTLYQQFAFVKSIVGSAEFNEAIQRILAAPVARWQDTEKVVDIRRLGRVNNPVIRQIVTGRNRILLPDNHFLKPVLISVPERIRISVKHDSTNNIENQFVKYVLTVFTNFSTDVRGKLIIDSREHREALKMEETLNNFLDHPIFKGMAQPFSLPLNNPVLQRKEGYREVLKVWLLFDLAAKLIWRGGDDVYYAGKRDVAKLYEYWLFFKLLDLLGDIFNITPKSIENLIEPTSDGLGLILKSGKFIALEGIYDNGSRELNIKFSYNRYFSGDKKYPEGGSWALSMRPDYTLSIWPFYFSEEEAEKQELIIHLHFDAKYKANNLEDIFGTEIQESDDGIKLDPRQQQSIVYKREDMLKMHAYKDAVRRTAGAYILYPGTKSCVKHGFHEIIPGLGAFNVQPSKTDDGTINLRNFIIDVVDHFINRSSQQERLSYHIFDIHKKKPSFAVKEIIPEKFGENREKPPQEISIIIGYCKAENYYWIINNKLYNVRMDTRPGSLRFDPKVATAEYVLIHRANELITGHLFRISREGPRVFSAEKMNSLNYYKATDNSYLVFDIETNPIPEFDGMKWDVSKLDGYKPSHASAIPFAVTLSELMGAKVLC